MREVDGRPVVEVTGPDGTVALPALWLRERSQAPDQLDLVTGHASSTRIACPPTSRWSTLGSTRGAGRRPSRMATARRSPSRGCSAPSPGDGCPPPRPWRSDLGRPPLHDWSALDADAGLRAALHDLIAYGVIVIDGAPTEPGTVLEVAGRLGHVRDTNFGRLFDVRTVPGLERPRLPGGGARPPHRQPLPRAGPRHPAAPLPGQRDHRRLVHPRRHPGRHRAAGRRRPGGPPPPAHRPRHVPLPRRRHGAGDAGGRWSRSTTRAPSPGSTTAPGSTSCRCSPRAELVAYQRARRRLAELLVDPTFELRFVLEPGQVLVFANDRVLHGRTELRPAGGQPPPAGLLHRPRRAPEPLPRARPGACGK